MIVLFKSAFSRVAENRQWSVHLLIDRFRFVNIGGSWHQAKASNCAGIRVTEPRSALSSLVGASPWRDPPWSCLSLR